MLVFKDFHKQINWVNWPFNSFFTLVIRSNRFMFSKVHFLPQRFHTSLSIMLSELRGKKPSSLSADPLVAGWWLWCWLAVFVVWGPEDAAAGPVGSFLLWLWSPSAFERASWSGWSHRWWGVAPSLRYSDAWRGSSPRPKPPLYSPLGLVGASSPHQQLREEKDAKSGYQIKDLSL